MAVRETWESPPSGRSHRQPQLPPAPDARIDIDIVTNTDIDTVTNTDIDTATNTDIDTVTYTEIFTYKHSHAYTEMVANH